MCMPCHSKLGERETSIKIIPHKMLTCNLDEEHLQTSLLHLEQRGVAAGAGTGIEAGGAPEDGGGLTSSSHL